MLKICVYVSLISEICVHGILQVNDISECSSELFPRRELGNRLRWTCKTPINPSQLRNLARSSICHSALHHKRGTPCDINLLTCFLNHFSYSFDSQANWNEPRTCVSLFRFSPSSFAVAHKTLCWGFHEARNSPPRHIFYNLCSSGSRYRAVFVPFGCEKQHHNEIDLQAVAGYFFQSRWNFSSAHLLFFLFLRAVDIRRSESFPWNSSAQSANKNMIFMSFLSPSRSSRWAGQSWFHLSCAKTDSVWWPHKLRRTRSHRSTGAGKAEVVIS